MVEAKRQAALSSLTLKLQGSDDGNAVLLADLASRVDRLSAHVDAQRDPLPPVHESPDSHVHHVYVSLLFDDDVSRTSYRS